MLGENYFLIALGLIWIIVAVIMDFRKREVENWWNFSLIAIALSYRAFVSLNLQDYRYFVYGVAGFAIFFGIANILYYSRVFAGGDAKLLMALGAVLPLSFSVVGNLMIFGYFIVLLLFSGGIYGLIFSVVLAVRNKEKFKEHFFRLGEKNKGILNVFFIAAIAIAIFTAIIDMTILVSLSMLILLFPLLYIYGKAVEESSMVKSVAIKKLTVGDWLVGSVSVGKRKIKSSWEGLSERQLALIQKKKGKVKIKQGIPFTPSFLIAFLILLWLMF